jgi:hypothetical protein
MAKARRIRSEEAARPADALDPAAVEAIRKEGLAIGDLLLKNLCRLGHGRMVVDSTGLSKLCAKAGTPMTRQRISQMMNAASIQPATIEALARAVKVPPSELLRRGD